jgi:ABC-type uncharacterized transport system substrate-binding protein
MRAFVLAAAILANACSFVGSKDTPPDGPTVFQAPSHVQPLRTAILISNDSAGYQRVAEEIMSRMPPTNYSVFHLEGKQLHTPDLLEELDRYEPDQIIAVGLPAAMAGRQRPDVPLVFCRVFDYESNDLISQTSTGVKLLPPFDLQLQAWKEISPNLNKIGVIMGPDQQDLLHEIEASALRHDIEIEHRTVGSDQETLFEFKRLIPLVQGLIVLPDNRILSASALMELMAYGTKHGKQIVVFNDNLLKYGALMSVTSDEADVADQVIRVFQDSASRKASRPNMFPLTKMRVQVNPKVAQDLGLPMSLPEFEQYPRSD